MLRRSFVSASLAAPFAAAAEPKFRRVFFHDKEKIASGFSGFAFPTTERGFVTGVQREGSGRLQGFLLSTKDGGSTWQEARLRFVPIFLQALEPGFLWAMSNKREIWFSAEYGLDWRKLSKLKQALTLHFVDPQNGFAAGVEKMAWKTVDGGRKWQPIAAATEAQGEKKYAAFQCIASHKGKLVSIFGNSQANRAYANPFGTPDWMQPEFAKLRRPRPALTLVLDSSDGGETFRNTSASTFGEVRQVRIGESGEGVVVVQFRGSFTYGGEVYRFRAGQAKELELMLRPKDIEVHDALHVPGQGYYVAGTSRTSDIDLPVPTPVKILFSFDGKEFLDVAVDYRAEARRVFLAYAGRNVFAATDEGMILKLS
ncbi:MAG: hypothetical protein NW208_15720 [Bryobacter sp.]|nr:hypothetical protein [Bryobacter sp.]